MKIQGFNKLLIRDIPLGIVFNKDNYEQFPLVECDTWISEDKNWQLDINPITNNYRITPLKLNY